MIMIEVWMIVVACLAPNFTECRLLESMDWKDPIQCQLHRPVVVSMFMNRVVNWEGEWITFTECQLIVPDQNGETR